MGRRKRRERESRKGKRERKGGKERWWKERGKGKIRREESEEK
jgi:hypothetical protein